MGFLTSFVENGEKKPATSEQEEKTQFWKGTTHDLFWSILETKMGNDDIKFT